MTRERFHVGHSPRDLRASCLDLQGSTAIALAPGGSRSVREELGVRQSDVAAPDPVRALHASPVRKGRRLCALTLGLLAAFAWTGQSASGRDEQVKQVSGGKVEVVPHRFFSRATVTVRVEGSTSATNSGHGTWPWPPTTPVLGGLGES